MTGSTHVLKLARTSELLHELRFLNMNQARQLNQLRIGYIVKFTDPEWSDHHHYKCLCKLTQDLNIYHFLNQCPKYDILRKEWTDKIANSVH